MLHSEDEKPEPCLFLNGRIIPPCAQLDETPDTETPDTETTDTETPDTETTDTETTDTETPDTGTPDTEAPDTETPDTETPAGESQTPSSPVDVDQRGSKNQTGMPVNRVRWQVLCTLCFSQKMS